MAEPTKSKAQRCLFGKPDPETQERNKEDAMDMLKKDTEEKTKKWNFDFENETPLKGRYQWEKVRSETPSKSTGNEQEKDEK